MRPTRRKPKPKRHASGATSGQREVIREWLNKRALKTLTEKTGLPGEAIVLEIRYWHQSANNPFSPNPTPTTKKRSYHHWKEACRRKGCRRALAFNDAVFHHLRRGIPNQHRPENMLPYHVECHDAHHEVKRGSLGKGSPRRRP